MFPAEGGSGGNPYLQALALLDELTGEARATKMIDNSSSVDHPPAPTSCDRIHHSSVAPIPAHTSRRPFACNEFNGASVPQHQADSLAHAARQRVKRHEVLDSVLSGATPTRDVEQQAFDAWQLSLPELDKMTVKAETKVLELNAQLQAQIEELEQLRKDNPKLAEPALQDRQHASIDCTEVFQQTFNACGVGLIDATASKEAMAKARARPGALQHEPGDAFWAEVISQQAGAISALVQENKALRRQMNLRLQLARGGAKQTAFDRRVAEKLPLTEMQCFVQIQKQFINYLLDAPGIRHHGSDSRNQEPSWYNVDKMRAQFHSQHPHADLMTALENILEAENVDTAALLQQLFGFDIAASTEVLLLKRVHLQLLAQGCSLCGSFSGSERGSVASALQRAKVAYNKLIAEGQQLDVEYSSRAHTKWFS